MYGITLNRKSPISLAKQLHLAITELIHSGCIKEQERLPSTRELAKELCISRNTVNEAYDLLITEGYVYSKAGMGYIVQKNLIFRHETPAVRSKTNNTPCREIRFNFSLGIPDVRSFPFALWNNCLKQAASGLKNEDFAYSDPQGYAPLQKEISAWLFRSRGIQVQEENIFITTGTTQAINLCLELLKTENKVFLTENPCYYPVVSALRRKNFSMHSISTDKYGIDTREIKRFASGICGLYVTPSHQFPNGSVLSAERRIELIKLAQERDFYILEDDYDGEFRYRHAPLAPLYSLYPERVIYMGTFSKMLFPALRIGFAILPQHFHTAWKCLRSSCDRQNAIHEQAALVSFLKERKIDIHVKRMNKIYEKKLHILLESLKRHFPCPTELLGINAGIHIALQVGTRNFDEHFYRKCLEQNIALSYFPCSSHQKEFAEENSQNNILYLGYGSIEESSIDSGIALLASLL